ncbi:MAG: alkaline phosphatase family protein [Pseudomonadota bacterium]|nr:alkaline phosphatase family protein [Pseudomonadota bacterium]
MKADRRLFAALLIGLSNAAACHARPAAAADSAVPRYAHVVVIVEENKTYGQILDPASAPNIAALAAKYGNATRFFGEVHPSEANYVAILGGDTFGIHDDDGFSCRAGSAGAFCGGSAAPGYADHTISAPHLGEQLEAAGLTWKGYYQSLPAPGSLVFTASDPAFDNGTRKTALYASKHSGFLNFASVQSDPRRGEQIVDFGRLDADLAANALPNFAFIVPNQCNEMHGLHGPNIPADCDGGNVAALIRRGDAFTGQLVKKIQATVAWKSAENFAIVITFDEGSGKTREGCCAVTPNAPSNFGGGHIPTVVIANHGPRGVEDATPYNHYSLLRTLEDAFGIEAHLAHAADADKGVVAMTRLFAVSEGAVGR